jgi:arylsulfatase A-like enzyme
MSNKFKISLTALMTPVVAACLLTGCFSDPVNDNSSAKATLKKDKPNVVVFYIDDLGYGDVGAYGATRVKTPNIDMIANNGLRFTDGHSSAATCTPSRYSLLTGEHGFRGKAAILPGDAPALIRPGKPTLPAMLKKAGYTTGVVGKWHLGLGDGNVDWNQDVKPGPLEIGVDYSFLLPATGDRVPTVYLDGHKVVGLDPQDPIQVSYKGKVGTRITGEENPELRRYVADAQHNQTIVNGVSRIGYMAGGESALWVDEEFPDVFTGKAVEFIRKNKNKPFFLFHSYHDIHVPRIPHPRFQGKSGMGPRGDAIVQMDWMVGQVIDELKALNLDKNTLVIFTSDNGPVLNDGYEDQSIALLGEHKPGGVYKGGKYSLYEAGTRVPTIAYWPETIKPMVSDALVSQIDIYASLAKLLDIDLSEGEAVDSQDMLTTWLGKTVDGRTELIEESFHTNALRQGQWKYIPSSKTKNTFIKENKGIEGGFQAKPQLFDLSVDPAERINLAAQNQERVAAMQKRVKQIVKSGY